MDILENPLSEPLCATNASSSNHQFLINNGGKSDSTDEFDKLHVENSSSNGSFLVDDQFLQQEIPVHSSLAGAAAGSSTNSEERALDFFSDDNNLFTAKDSEEKTSESVQNTTGDDSNVFAIERDATLVSSSPNVRRNDKSYNTNLHDGEAFDSSPRIEDNDPFKNTFQSSPGTQPVVDNSPKTVEISAKRIQIDTAAPIESVKHAVSRFGGILDWKAHRAHTMEKRQIIEQELERVGHEIPFYNKLCEDSEDSKKKILKDLDGIKRLIEEMKIHLEKVQTEELQAKQDAELAKLQVEEMEQGIAGDASISAKAQLEVAKARYAAAISELKAVKDELEALGNDYVLLVNERDSAMIKAQEAVSASRKVEKEVEDLTIELMTVKETLETAHASHLEADEQRIIAAEARKQVNSEEAFHQTEEELEKLNQKFTLKKELKSKLDSTSALLKDLKAELAAYMQSKTTDTEQSNTNRASIQSAIDSTKKELEEVKANIEKAINEVDCLQVTATSMKIEVERDKYNLNTITQKERTSSLAVSSLESEIKLKKSKIDNYQKEVKAAREKMEELDKQLDESAQEAEEATIVVKIIDEKVLTAKDESEQAKARAKNMESRLLLAQKEIEAAKATEKLALAAITAMQECESARAVKDDETPTGVNLSLEQYYDLSKQAHDAEEEANTMIKGAFTQIDVAKESELTNLRKLEKLGHEITEKRSSLQIALQKAEKAKEEKMEVEQELRQWRADHEQKRKAMDPPSPTLHSSKSPRSSFGEDKETMDLDSAQDDDIPNQSLSPKATLSESQTLTETSDEVHPTKKKKKSFFPRFLLFFAKKKAHSKNK